MRGVEQKNPKSFAFPIIVKQNTSSTLNKLINTEEELVKKLDFLDFIDYKNLSSEVKNNLFYRTTQGTKSTGFIKDCETQSSMNLIDKLGSSHIKSMESSITEKISNFNLEKKLNEELKYVGDQITSLSEIREDFSKSILEKTRIIDDLSLDIEYILKHHPIVKHKDKLNYMIYQNIKGSGEPSNLSSNSTKKASLEFKYSELSNETQIQISQARSKMEDKRNKELNELKNKLAEARDGKDQLLNEFETIQTEISEYKLAEKEIKQMLVVHYHKLLQEGKDTRGVGLVWIIKEIYFLGSDVITSYMPKFLDDKAIAYLFLYAQLTMEKQKIYDKLSLLKKELRFINRKYLDFDKILDKFDIDSPLNNLKQIVEILPANDRPELKFGVKRTKTLNSLSQSQSTESGSPLYDKCVNRGLSITSSFDSQSSKENKALLKIIESPAVNHKIRNMPLTTKALEIIPEHNDNMRSSKQSTMISSSNFKTPKSESAEFFSSCSYENKLARIKRVKEWKKSQNKIDRFTDCQLSSNLTPSQKNYLVVEKAIRAGINEKEIHNVNFKSLENYLDKKNRLNPSSVRLIKQVSFESERLNQIDTKIKQLIEDEMNRVFKEIFNFDYLRRFKTTKKILISALVGEKALFSELIRQDQEAKVSIIS